jgi:hypothetical protein
MYNTRILRENASFNDKVNRLTDVKMTLIKYTYTNFDTIDRNYFLTHKSTKNLYEKNSYYLHFLIMFKKPMDVHNFLNEHRMEFGDYATKIFINYPLVNFIAHNIVTPLMCSAHWSNDPDMIRVLYAWGADLSIIDVFGKYPEEQYGGPYYNHLYPYIGQTIETLGFRSNKEFIYVIQECSFLSGDRAPPQNWKAPVKILP